VPYGGMWDMTWDQLDIESLLFSKKVENKHRLFFFPDLRRCSGYKKHWECADDYPNHMVPVDEFGKGVSMCGRCKTRYDSIRNPTRERHPVTGQFKMDWKTAKAIKLGGDIGNRHTPEWKSYLNDAEVQWNIEVKNHILDNRPAKEYFDWVDSQKESVVKQRVVSIKSRDSSLPNRMKKEYSYRCQVEKCNESSEVELAHLYPHSKPDSVDNPTNALVLCANHHRALDGHRMCIELDLTFSRYDREDNQIEWGEIICHEWHKIDPKFIKKSQEWFRDDNTKK